MSSEEEYDVTLYVYDLSNGLVKQMSKALVGREFEGMWHTGIVVFGHEFFWAGDLQCTTAGRTQYGRPVKTIPLGKTHIPKELIYEYVETMRSEYNPSTYSLLSKNCNNFSNDFATFLTGHGIPEDILNLPQEVLSTPLGAAIRPFIESMEQQSRQQGQASIFYPPSIGVAPQQAPQVPAAQPQPQPNPEPTNEAKIKERTAGAIRKDSGAMVSGQGNAKTFISKLEKEKKLSTDLGSLLEAIVCSPTGKEEIPNSLYEFFETALSYWGAGDCAGVLFIFRKFVMHPRFAEHYLSTEKGPYILGRMLGWFISGHFPSHKTTIGLGLAAASNVFATAKGAELMIHPGVCGLVLGPALDKVTLEDAGTRLMALGLVYNYSRYALPRGVGEKCVQRVADAVTGSFEGESESEDAEYRALLALGHLLYNNPSLGKLLSENYDLIAVVISYQTSENEKIASLAKEVSDILDEINGNGNEKMKALN